MQPPRSSPTFTLTARRAAAVAEGMMNALASPASRPARRRLRLLSLLGLLVLGGFAVCAQRWPAAAQTPLSAEDTFIEKAVRRADLPQDEEKVFSDCLRG